jgi:hypothetical protein
LLRGTGKEQTAMTERKPDPFEDQSDQLDLEDGVLPGVDLQLGGDDDAAGDTSLDTLDEENLYGNDVIVNDEEIGQQSDSA